MLAMGVAAPQISCGQEEDEIETDRDSFTPATSTTSSGRLIAETAYSFIDERSVAEVHSFPELVTRYGLTDIFELRLGCNYEIGGAGNPVSGEVPTDLGEESPGITHDAQVQYGFKVFLTDQDGWVPQSSCIVQGITPTSGPEKDSQLSATYVAGWRLANDWVWNSALRISTSSPEGDHFNVWSPSTVLKVPVGQRSKAHAEYFGVFTNGRTDETSQHFFSSGASYLVTNNLEVGARVGWGLNQQSPNFFSNVGVGWRY